MDENHAALYRQVDKFFYQHNVEHRKYVSKCFLSVSLCVCLYVCTCYLRGHVHLKRGCGTLKSVNKHICVTMPRWLTVMWVHQGPRGEGAGGCAMIT